VIAALVPLFIISYCHGFNDVQGAKEIIDVIGFGLMFV
jgi:hypothetical protein